MTQNKKMYHWSKNIHLVKADMDIYHYNIVMQMLIEDKQNLRKPRIKQQNIQGMMREGSTEKAPLSSL